MASSAPSSGGTAAYAARNGRQSIARNPSPTGYGQLVLERFGPVWGWFAAGDLLFTNLVTLIAEFAVIRVGLSYFHLGPAVAAGLGVALVAVTLSGGRYWRWERASGTTTSATTTAPRSQLCTRGRISSAASCGRSPREAVS